jgi:hypothetical protein
VDGYLLSKVRVRLHVSRRLLGLDCAAEQRKRTHLDVFGRLLSELEHELPRLAGQHRADGGPPEGCALLVESILGQGRARLQRHQQLDASDFRDDAVLRWAAKEAVGAKALGRAKLLLWLESADRAAVAGLELEESGRLRLARQRRRLASLEGGERAGLALDMCRSIGLVVRDTAERNELGETPLLAAAALGERWAQRRPLNDAHALCTAIPPSERRVPSIPQSERRVPAPTALPPALPAWEQPALHQDVPQPTVTPPRAGRGTSSCWSSPGQTPSPRSRAPAAGRPTSRRRPGTGRPWRRSPASAPTPPRLAWPGPSPRRLTARTGGDVTLDNSDGWGRDAGAQTGALHGPGA